MSKELFISSSPHETKVAVWEDDELVEVYHERDTGAGLVGGIYKGRVSRVLPGMQSAFVDVGLERDAFLYVSDFFEDSEEYDKVVSEAEARVSRYAGGGGVMSGPGAPASTGASAAPTPPAQAETAPVEASATEPAARADEYAPPPPSSTASGAAETTVTSESEPGAQTIASAAPPAPEAPPATAASSESATSESAGSGRPFGRPNGPPKDGDDDHEYRGRRRRRRGRGGFRERRFESPRPETHERPPQSSAPSHDFEVLPGESLAKHSPSSHEESSPAPAPRPESVEPARDVAPDFVPSEIAPTAQEEAAPAGAVEVPEPLPGPADFPAPSATLEPDAYHDSLVAASEPAVPGASEVAFETAPSQETETPSANRSTDEAAAARDLGVEWPRESFGAPSGEAARDHGEPAIEALTTDEVQAEAGFDASSAGAAADASTVESIRASFEEAAASQEAAGSAESTALAPSAEGSPEQPAAAGERSYTLREPSHRRPHFAPRRGRRGRRGPGERDRGDRGERDRSRPRGGPSYASESRPGNNQPVQISELLKEGQEILVQIAKEPLGNKGARITSHIALPGRYLVYMPTIHHIGVSRKIGSEEERLRLRNIILEHRGSLTGGFIVRTAGAGRSEEEFKADLRFLSALWSEIRGKAERSRAPALLHRDLDLVQRILRDMLSPDFKSVRVDNETEYERVLDFVSRCQPSLAGHVKLWNREAPLFEEFGIQAEIDKALKPKIWLKSGGFIVINQTEALVAIDVNTGKYVGRTNRLEDTIVKTNIDAVKEIVRQIRLRDLGGIVVIDFIDMDERRNRQKVVQALEEALRADRAPTNILSINEFGLVALTRKRVKQSLERTLCEPCPYCTGAGWIKSASTICFEILAEARKMAGEIEGKTLTLRINPEVARVLKSRDGTLLSELESLTGKDVIIKSDPSVHQERFEIF